jgi:hypothetical protein
VHTVGSAVPTAPEPPDLYYLVLAFLGTATPWSILHVVGSMLPVGTTEKRRP